MTLVAPCKSASPSHKDLYREGYGVEPTTTPGVFRVIRPARRGGGCYLVNAVTDRCNCAARVRCRHRIGLRALVLTTACRLEDEGCGDEAARLLMAWAEVVEARAIIASVERRAA